MEGFKTLPDKSVDMILTDIPFNVINRPSNGLRKLNKSHADRLTFDLKKFLKECLRVCHGSIYIFCSSEQVSFIREFMIEGGMSTRIIVWEKSNPSPMNGRYIWLSGIELCVYGKFRGAVFNEKCKNTVLRYPVVRNAIHPTQKPVELFEYLIKTSTNKSDIILDPCLGSGTTIAACLKTNRNYIGFELNKNYYKKTLTRLNI
jgi:site-specific DNA-methyltransferase (adenine-specific)